MSKFAFLMRREWLQHRFAWALMVLAPLAIAVLLVSFGTMQFDGEERLPHFPVVAAMAAIGGATALYGVIVWVSSMIIVSGIARRDHADRSVEFWLSLPTGHAESLAAPLLVHTVLVPIAALAAGALSGIVVSLVLITRVADIGTWVTLPWPLLLAAVLSLVARLAVGIVLATVWLSPIILSAVLLTAWFKRWGLVIQAVGIGLGSWVMAKVFGHPFLIDVLGQLLENAGRSVMGADPKGFNAEGGDQVIPALAAVPAWALEDVGVALSMMASPLLLGGVLVAAGCFYGLVQWRRMGAGAAG